MAGILLTGGRVLDPASGTDATADVRIAGAEIVGDRVIGMLDERECTVTDHGRDGTLHEPHRIPPFR